MPLSEEQRIEMLEALATDDSLKATQRLRALEELGRIAGRRQQSGSGQSDRTADEEAPDPMADLDELESRRRRRAA